jgi:mannitol-1-phosphate/altronate dehydrogenase
MNKINSAQFVKRHVEVALEGMVGEEKANQIMENTYFIETVVNRMVSSIPDDVIISRVQAELEKMNRTIVAYAEKMGQIIEFSKDYFSANSPDNQNDPLDENGAIYQTVNLAANISSVTKFAVDLSKLNFTLFSSEPDMPLYALKGSPFLERFRQVVIVDNIDSMQEIKNKLSNGSHAIIAWYSALLGYKTIGQGMGDPRVSKLAKSIIRNEISPALLIENPNSKRYIDSIASTFLQRCRASFKDDCTRVGRDPLRKLQSGERIIGAIQLVQKYGLSTKGLEFGVACAIMYSIRSIDESDKEARKIKQLYEKNNSILDVLTYSGEYYKSKYVGLDIEKDSDLIMRIQERFDSLNLELQTQP